LSTCPDVDTEEAVEVVSDLQEVVGLVNDL
jgi:hypothetical protein